MDTKLEGQYPQKGAFIAATIALPCLSREPKLRPNMTEVLSTLEELQSLKSASRPFKGENRTSFDAVSMSPLKHRNSPRNVTTLASPLPSYLRSPPGSNYEFTNSEYQEELLLAGQCCTFRGSLVKLDIRNGKILWQMYTLPNNGGKLRGYSGAAIWGSSPSIDIFRGLVYVGTGNLYLAPADFLRCQVA
ncbi:uncharacterized protein Fot_16020 [Forsythia ovata]|uniref:Uncharacterized protein n=1 Tax=Forsythia ovata TaxID=205694 RepID=A0ABD1WB17_9LAMI